MDEAKKNEIVRVITDDIKLTYPSGRIKTRVIEDGNGVWRIQSFVSSKDLPRADELPPEIWRDEYDLNSEFPREYSSLVMNLSELMKNIYDTGKSDGKYGI